VRQPVARSTDFGVVTNGERSAGAIHYQRDFSGRTHQTRNRLVKVRDTTYFFTLFMKPAPGSSSTVWSGQASANPSY
jgi:hypothetical protein